MTPSEIKTILADKRILFVEDEKSLQDSAGATLKGVCKEVIIADDGKIGLEIFNQRKDIDLILSDINMPNMSGTDLLKNIRKTGSNIPFVFMTAYTDKEKMDVAIEYSADSYAVKPIDIRNLLETIAMVFK